MRVPSPVRNAGYTLLELSVVILIAGLIAGGIFVGKNLLQSAKLRQLTTDLQDMESAVHLYEDRYNALPGDHSTATDYWGAATGNGNGDGYVFDHGGAGDAADEDGKAIQHMALAKLLSFPVPTSFWPQVPGVNFPAGPFDAQGYRLQSWPWSTGTMDGLWGKTGVSIVVGTSLDSWDIYSGFMTPQQAWNIDKKIDDGIPTQGQLFGAGTNGDHALCLDMTNPGKEVYLLSSDQAECLFEYWLE